MRRDILLVIGFGILVLCPFLGTRDLWSSGEARVAEAAREMRESGDWIVPRIGGELRLEKPPLAYWLVVAASLPFEDVTEFNSRLPSLFGALGALVLTYLFGRRLWNPRIGVWAALMLATTLAFWNKARDTGIEMHLLFLILLALYAWLRYAWPDAAEDRVLALNRSASGWWLILCYVAMAFSFLDKGPVGPLLLVPIILVYRLATRSLLRMPALRWHAFGMILLAFIALPWYMVVMHRIPEAMGIWLHQSVDRYEGFAHPHSPVYFLGVLAGDAQPWLFLAIMAVFVRPNEEPLRRRWLFPLTWAGVVLLLFSIPTDKKSYYILPMYPALALCGAWMLDRWMHAGVPARIARCLRVYHRIAAALLMGLGLAAMPAYLHFIQPGGWHADFAACGLQVFALALIAGVLGYFLWVDAGVGSPRRTAETILAGTVLFFGVYIAMLPTVNRHKGTRQLCKRLFAAHPVTRATGAYAYDYRGIPLLTFYLRHSVTRFASRDALRGFLSSPPAEDSILVIPEGDYRNLSPDLQGRLVRIVEARPSDKHHYAWFRPSRLTASLPRVN